MLQLGHMPRGERIRMTPQEIADTFGARELLALQAEKTRIEARISEISIDEEGWADPDRAEKLRDESVELRDRLRDISREMRGEQRKYGEILAGARPVDRDAA